MVQDGRKGPWSKANVLDVGQITCNSYRTRQKFRLKEISPPGRSWDREEAKLEQGEVGSQRLERQGLKSGIKARNEGLVSLPALKACLLQTPPDIMLLIGILVFG